MLFHGSVKLTTETALAAMLDKSEEWVAERRRRKGWPHVRLSRFDVRYTDRQIEQIIAWHTVTPAANPPRSPVPGQTKRSAARGR